MNAVAKHEALGSKNFANINVRIPAVSHEMIKTIAETLNTSISTVVNAVVEFAFMPEKSRAFWQEGVVALRKVVEAGGMSEGRQLVDYAADEWGEKLQWYNTLDRLGLVDNLEYKFSPRNPDRVICSFRLNITGAIVASICEAMFAPSVESSDGKDMRT